MQQVGAHLAPLCPELVSIEELQDRGLLACAVVFGEEVICPIGNSCRVTEANELYINNMALNEKVSSRGGSHWTEHPLDPGCDPYPSLWNTSEMQESERRTKAVKADFHQCVFGARCRRPRPP